MMGGKKRNQAKKNPVNPSFIRSLQLHKAVKKSFNQKILPILQIQ